MSRLYHTEWAWLDGAVARDVLIRVEDGRFTAIAPETTPAPGAVRLPGLALPGMANAHSHAFHRALRGRTHAERGTFWTWRERMYEVAARLEPDTYLALATAAYTEMAQAGITSVGEFHYLHHDPSGRPYADPNAMGAAVIEAAARVGVRVTLLDTLYLTSSVDGEPLSGVQARFGDGDLDGWVRRTDALKPHAHARIGAAAHSVRAVPAEVLAPFAAHTADRPTHLHLSEQRAENDACRARYGRTPTELLAEAGLLRPETTVVHATHLSLRDRTLLGGSGTRACLCPTTERDLADGIGPARALADAGSPLCLGSDSHAVVDMFEEARGLELHERLRTEVRGHFRMAELIEAATRGGHEACGWLDAGTISVGARADLVAVRLDSLRTAGVDPIGAVFTATAADVWLVMVDGREIVREGRHVDVDGAAALREAIGGLA